MALQRLRNTEKKIEKDPVVKEAYETTLQTYLNKGYITEVNPNENFNDIPIRYEFKTLVFGVNASPFLAQYVSRHNAELHKEEYPRAAETVFSSTYMDDSMDSVSTVEEESDNYTTLTKRTILRKIATIFDPHGFVAPYIVRAKILMQELWLAGLNWDEIVPNEMNKTFLRWLSELKELKQIKIPRCIRHESYVQLKRVTLHAFGDASEKAYGSVVYARCEDSDNNISVRLVAAKSRVALVKTISIPRLELLAAVLCLILTLSICAALNICINNCTFWTDSMNVLHWIRNRSTIFKPFVANRIGEIQYHSNPIQWRHVQGKQNPADILSRGCSISYLETNELWWNAPEFLKKNECEWPKSKVEFSHENSEIKKSKKKMQFEVQTMHTQSADVQTYNKEWRLDPKRYSSWTKLVRVYAWVMRFVENCKRTKTARIEGQLGANEIHDAEVKLIIKAQRSHYKEEFTCLFKQKELPKDSKLIKLNPKIDGEGVIRSDGRLKYAEMLSYGCRYPVILPRHDWITELIVRHFHEDSGHSGTNYTLSVLSTSAREVIRAVENKCTKCKLRKARPKEQIMAPLPNIRHNMPLRAFVHVAVDYAGPFVTVQGRGKRREKRYLCLFTCLSTRAVHLEIAFGMDVDSFLNAFYRMVSRRGLPKTMLSDNGSNFVRADKELKQLLQCLDQDKIIENTANKGIQWQFIPPFAPHWGGVHEIMIKSAKRAT
ncbi:uncharacterized protein LOC128558105 [Mercenaria mercenaria]|uniref:uncharacterized protein LOC128558105 n=1 Tax=Mercenaria mercenaria TaxID=6596 RepID=UPI00234F00EC|nr:uncharacterized protein LOC128558105 [Mercenaria mercenaria]